MSVNTAVQVQEALVAAATNFPGSDLSKILKTVEETLHVGVNEQWAVEALESRGFKVADLPDRAVTPIALTDE